MPNHSPSSTGKRLLVINPNTNAAVTQRVRRAAEDCAQAGTRLDVVNPEHGPLAIESVEDRAAAAPHVLELIRRSDGYDGYVLACFDDIAVAEARDFVAAPVISMAEAGVRAAASHHSRFDVVTTVTSAVPTIEMLVASYGMGSRCRVHATGIGVSDTAAATVSAEAALEARVNSSLRSGAQAIVLGSGAYAGRKFELSQRFGVPIIDGLEAAVAFCEAHFAAG